MRNKRRHGWMIGAKKPELNLDLPWGRRLGEDGWLGKSDGGREKRDNNNNNHNHNQTTTTTTTTTTRKTKTKTTTKI